MSEKIARLVEGWEAGQVTSDEVLAELALEIVRIWLELHELEKELKEVKPASMSLHFATV